MSTTQCLNLELTRLRNEEWFQYQTEFRDLVNTKTPATLDVAALFNLYKPLYADADTALKIFLKSHITTAIAEADEKRDRYFLGFREAVASFHNHFDLNKVNAASQVAERLNHYGNLARKSYDEETAALENLVQEMGREGTYSFSVAMLGFDQWIEELSLANQEFETLVKARDSEAARQTQLRMKTVRKEADSAYQAIIDRINAHITLTGSAPHLDFASQLNAIIERYKLHLVQRAGRRTAEPQPEASPVS